VQVPPDAQCERHAGGRQFREGRAHVIEQPRVEIGPLEVAVFVEVPGVGPGGRREPGDSGADPAYGVRCDTAFRRVIAGNGITEDEAEPLRVGE
jgi:hypothetical protein